MQTFWEYFSLTSVIFLVLMILLVSSTSEDEFDL